MIDLSANKITLNNIEDIYCQIKEESNKKINRIWLGTQDYQAIFDLQKLIHSKRIDKQIGDIILMLEHQHVYTLGKNANYNHILSLDKKRSNIIKVDRGGDVTYHGPGQLVSYPIIDLNGYSKSITWYVNILQESIVSALYEYNIKANYNNNIIINSIRTVQVHFNGKFYFN